MTSVIALQGNSMNIMKLSCEDICKYKLYRYSTDVNGCSIYFIYLQTDEKCVIGSKFFNTEINGEIIFIKTTYNSSSRLNNLIPINYTDIPQLTEYIDYNIVLEPTPDIDMITTMDNSMDNSMDLSLLCLEMDLSYELSYDNDNENDNIIDINMDINNENIEMLDQYNNYFETIGF